MYLPPCIERLNEELDTLSRRKRSAYEDYQDGIITKAEYIEYRDAYEEQIEKQQNDVSCVVYKIWFRSG